MTTKKERLIRMPYAEKQVSKTAKILFPIIITMVAGLFVPRSVALVGFLMFGNLIRECGLEDGDTLVSFVNGLVTNERDLTDEMYENAAMHDENGAWQMIFGVVTHPDYQRRGCAEKLLRYVVEQARTQGRRGLVLTCKERLVHFYAKIGFVDEGISESTHGGVVWHKMRLMF